MIIFKASWAKVYFFKRMTFIMLIVSRWLSLCFTKMLDLSCGYFYSLRLRKRHFTSPTFVAFCCVTLDLLCVILHRWHRQLRKWRCNTRQRSYSFYFYFYFYFYNGFLYLFVFVGLFVCFWARAGFLMDFFSIFFSFVDLMIRTPQMMVLIFSCHHRCCTYNTTIDILVYRCILHKRALFKMYWNHCKLIFVWNFARPVGVEWTVVNFNSKDDPDYS